MAMRLYQVWKGRNIFFLNGRLMFGPDARSLLLTVSLILVPVIIFCAFVGRNLVHKFQEHNWGYAVMVIAVVFTIYVMVLLLLTSARDPGIVPRNSHPPEEELGYESSPSVEAGDRAPGLKLPRTKEVIVNGSKVRVKYCDTCMIYRPPRASHCSVCDNCVERFDHHCPWLGQCIGKRNYRCFFMFVCSSTLLCAFEFSLSALYMKFLVDDYGTVWKAMKESPVAVILTAYCFLWLWFVGGLTGFHLYLIATNQTSYENYRYRAVNRNIHNKGCMGNFVEVFCTKIEPSRNNFHALINEAQPKQPHKGGQYTPKPEPNSIDERQVKIEDDLQIGNDLSNISQRRDFDEQIGDIRTRGSQRAVS